MAIQFEGSFPKHFEPTIDALRRYLEEDLGWMVYCTFFTPSQEEEINIDFVVSDPITEAEREAFHQLFGALHQLMIRGHVLEKKSEIRQVIESSPLTRDVLKKPDEFESSAPQEKSHKHKKKKKKKS